MYFHPITFKEFFSSAFHRKSTRKLLRTFKEIMEHIPNKVVPR